MKQKEYIKRYFYAGQRHKLIKYLKYLHETIWDFGVLKKIQITFETVKDGRNKKYVIDDLFFKDGVNLDKLETRWIVIKALDFLNVKILSIKVDY